MSKTEALLAFVLDKGFVEIPSKSNKYRTFGHPSFEWRYFIGKRGALRKGRNVSSSIPTILDTDKIHSFYSKEK